MSSWLNKDLRGKDLRGETMIGAEGEVVN